MMSSYTQIHSTLTGTRVLVACILMLLSLPVFVTVLFSRERDGFLLKELS